MALSQPNKKWKLDLNKPKVITYTRNVHLWFAETYTANIYCGDCVALKYNKQTKRWLISICWLIIVRPTVVCSEVALSVLQNLFRLNLCCEHMFHLSSEFLISYVKILLKQTDPCIIKNSNPMRCVADVLSSCGQQGRQPAPGCQFVRNCLSVSRTPSEPQCQHSDPTG